MTHGIRIGFILLISSFSITIVNAFSGSGSGIVGDPYIITTCSEFTEIIDDRGAAYELANDLDCTGLGTGIIIGTGAGDMVFSGTLDGGGFMITFSLETLSGTKQGLFEILEEATITDLILSGSSRATTFEGTYAGLLAGQSSGSLFEDIQAVGVVESYTYVGGLVGSSRNDTFTDITLSVISSGSTYVGGLAGDMRNAQLTNVSGQGEIYAQIYGGGIAGNVFTGYADAVSFSGTLQATSAYQGGIFGNGQYVYMTGGTINGTMFGSSFSSYYAGVVGSCIRCTVHDIAVAMDITSTSSLSYVGGVIGSLNVGTITDSTYEGDITLGSAGSFVGGIVGSSIQTTIDGVTVATDIVGDEIVSFFGGVVGTSTSTIISNAYVRGTITVDSISSFIGGIVGSANTTTLERVAALTELVGGDTVSYFGGVAGSVISSLVTDSYARGTITVGNTISDIAGLLGTVGGTSSEVHTSFASVAITSTISTEPVDRLISNASPDAIISQVFRNNDIASNFNTSLYGSGKQASELKELETFTTAGRDIAGTTDYGSVNDGFPFLAFEVGEEDPVRRISVGISSGKKSSLTPEETDEDDETETTSTTSSSKKTTRSSGKDTTTTDDDDDDSDAENLTDERPRDEQTTEASDETSQLCTTSEESDAYVFAREHNLTTMSTCEEAQLDQLLLRKHAAKILVNFAQTVLGLERNPDLLCSFTDMNDEDKEMNYYALTACQLGLMGLDGNGAPKTTFDPNAPMTKAQLATILSRALYGTSFNTADPCRYCNHIEALQSAGIITVTTDLDVPILRGRALLMMKRAAE